MIEFVNVTKKYEHDVTAINDISVKINKGEFVFLVGPSGSGKSTFLKLILKEEIPSEGKVIFDGMDLSRVKEREVPYIRRKAGCVFQDFRLLYDRTVYDNIVFALRIVGASDREIKTQVSNVLELVGLKGKEGFYPNQLSGGEQQRVGLARALVTKPPLVIADEPTGNLDEQTAEGIMNLLYQVNAAGTTILVVTHNLEFVKRSQRRVISLESGKIVSDIGGEKDGN